MEHPLTRRTLLRSGAVAVLSLAGGVGLAACGGAATAPLQGQAGTPTGASTSAAQQGAAATGATTQQAASTTSSTSAAAVTTNTTAASSATPATTAAASSRRTSLEFLIGTFADPAVKQIQDSLLPDFEQKNPAYQVVLTNGGSGTPYVQKYISRVAAGDPPDLVFLSFPHFSFVANGTLLDFDPYAKADKTVNWATDFYPQVTDYYRIPAGGLWGLPYNYATEVLYYNTNIFRDAGLKAPDDNYTYQQQLQDAQALVRRSSTGVDRWGIQVRLTRIDQVLWAYGGAFVDDQATKSRITEPGSIQGLQYIADLYNKWKVAPTEDDLKGVKAATTSLFSTSKLAMQYDPEWGAPMFNPIADLSYDVALMPKGPTGQFTFFFPGGVAGSKATKSPEGAYALARWFVWDDAVVNALIVDSPTGESPTAKIKANESYWDQKLTKPPHRALFLQSPSISKIPFFLLPHGEQTQQVVWPGLEPLWQGKATAEQVAATLEPQINALLQRSLQLPK
jgi:multiple sugar transport system substrate-binding protein